MPRILAISVLLVEMVMAEPQIPALAQRYTPDSLFIALLSNGDALVEYDIQYIEPHAAKVTVALFGQTISDLIVTDFSDNIVNFSPGKILNKIVLSTTNTTGAKISYSTPDLVSKDKRLWNFSLDSPVSFSIKMPPNSAVIDWGDSIPSIMQIGDQTLLTFMPGSVKISYIIGFLGTEEQANITIKLAETTIKETESKHPGIVLAGAKSVLDKALAAKGSGMFAEAEKLAAQANDLVNAAANNFVEAKSAIANADEQMRKASAENRDVTAATTLFEQANNDFASGNYTGARASASQVGAAIGQVQQSFLPFVVIGPVVAGVAVGAFLMLRRRSAQKVSGYVNPPKGVIQNAAHSMPEPVGMPDFNTTTNLENVPSIERPTDIPPLEWKPVSQTDKNLLVRIVARIMEERSHLRQEDRDVLQFLAEKEGAAFESEVRSKFNLPKTTVWRLVKRLEREELVEIRKTGGQNLIKLRFEDRQP